MATDYDPNIVFLSSTQNNLIVSGILKGLNLKLTQELETHQKRLSHLKTESEVSQTDDVLLMNEIEIVDHDYQTNFVKTNNTSSNSTLDRALEFDFHCSSTD